MKKNGFTLMEVMICTMVVGVMAASAVPMMQGVVERNRETEAELFLKTIDAAEKIYFMKNGVYYPVGTGKSFGRSPSSQSTLNEINQNLNIELARPKYFEFTLSTNWAPGPYGEQVYHYEALASRTYNTWIMVDYAMTDHGTLTRTQTNTQPQ